MFSLNRTDDLPARKRTRLALTPFVGQVMEFGKQWHGFLAKPEGHKLMKAGEQQGEEDSDLDNMD